MARTDRPRTLGAIIAGGRSLRFGSDKAVALVDGRPMIAHVIDALKPQVDMLVICGHTWPETHMLADLREGRIGPLAGLETALRFASQRGFDGVLSAPVDTLPLPLDLGKRLAGPKPAVLCHQYLIGYWPVQCGPLLTRHIDSGARSLSSWVARCSARPIDETSELSNINCVSDLEGFRSTDCPECDIFSEPKSIAVDA